MLTTFTEEDQLLIDEGSFTLSQQLEVLGKYVNKSCSQAMYLHSNMNFNELIKPNPFEFNWKELMTFQEGNEEFNSGIYCEENGRECTSAEIKMKAQDDILQMGSSNLGETPTITASKGITRELEDTKAQNSNKNGDKKQRNNSKKKLTRSLKEIREEKEEEPKFVTMNSTGKMPKTFPHGILKMGDRSRFSRSFEEKSFVRGFSDSFSRSQGNSASLKSQRNPSGFAKFK